MKLRRPLPSNENSWVSIQQPLLDSNSIKELEFILDRVYAYTVFLIIYLIIYIYTHRLFFGLCFNFFFQSFKKTVHSIISKVFKRGRPKPTTTWRCSLRAMLRSMNCWEIPENWLLRVETEFCCICKGHLFWAPSPLRDDGPLFCLMCPWGLKTLWWN